MSRAKRGGRTRRGGVKAVLLVILVLVVAASAILAFLVFQFVQAARSAATVARAIAVRGEVASLNEALERYKDQYGDYPPDFSDPVLVERHVRRAFYRNQDPVPTDLSPAEALVFWLSGFSPNPEHPFTGTGERRPLFEFDKTRLVDLDGSSHQEYVPLKESRAPYVYFQARSYDRPEAVYRCGEGKGTARPYRADGTDKDYARSKSFQIIAAGADDDYGDGGSFPSGDGYTEGDWDNITNFSDGTLRDEADSLPPRR